MLDPEELRRKIEAALPGSQVVVRDLTGRMTAWIEVGLPDAARLHRGSKLAGRAAIYTHRDARQLLTQLSGAKIHRAADIPIRAFDRVAIEEVAELIEWRASLAISVSDGEVTVAIGERMFTLPMTEHRIL